MDRSERVKELIGKAWDEIAERARAHRDFVDSIAGDIDLAVEAMDRFPGLVQKRSEYSAHDRIHIAWGTETIRCVILDVVFPNHFSDLEPLLAFFGEYGYTSEIDDSLSSEGYPFRRYFLKREGQKRATVALFVQPGEGASCEVVVEWKVSQEARLVCDELEAAVVS